MDNPIVLTPDYLLSHGFFQVDEKTELDSWFDIETEEGEVIYLEKDPARNRFAVCLTEYTYKDSNDKWYGFRIFIQYNIGFGFVEIPCNLSEMPVANFEMIYEGIRWQKNK
jgi:hypothetical protein